VSGQGKRIGCVLVAHGNVGQCLMEAVQGILGKQANWVAVSNAGMGLGDLNEAVKSAVGGEERRGQPVIGMRRGRDQ